MHATQHPGTSCPEPTGRLDGQPETPAAALAGILGDPVRFRAHIAAQIAPSLAETALAARECRKCGESMIGVYSWDVPLCPDCVTVVPADNEYGYLITDAGLQVLEEATPGEAPGTVAFVLRSTATYLERYGWIQGAYYDATSGSFTPPACLVGGIGMVCYGGPVDAPAQHFDDPGFLDFEAAVLHLDRYLLAEDGSESYEFNDAKGRRLDDVTHVLRDAATRPAEELIDALRAIDAKNADTAALAAMLVPSGVARCPYCGSTRRAVRAAIDEGDGPAFCDHDWHDGDSGGGDVR